MEEKYPGVLRMDDAPKNINEHGLTPDQQRDRDILFGSGEFQHIIFINIPYLNHEYTEKFVVGAVYNVVRAMLPPSLPHLLPPLKGPRSYSIRDIPGKGKGVIATRDIAPGEIVIIERPILIYPLTVYVEAVEPFQQYARESMDPRDWIKYHELVNVKDGCVSEFDGIRATNAFTIKLKEDKEDYCGVFLESSRLNHSCGPNLQHSWDPGLFTFSLQAVRSIRAGQELTVAYEDLCSSRADRQFNLQRLYKFRCRCEHCEKPSRTSNQDRRAAGVDMESGPFEQMYQNITIPGLPRHVGHQYATSLSNTILKKVAANAREGIQSYSFWHYVYLMKVSGLLGDKNKFKHWGFKVLLFSVRYTEVEGETGFRQVEQWIDWVKEPEKNFPDWGRFR